jgi:uncharacterized protein (TIGR02680 family)
MTAADAEHPRPAEPASIRAERGLPDPVLARWQPLRLGLVELYHYDVEEFWFRDGHLLLRGNNGTGKSKILSLTLPFLLDANLSSARVEPDGDRHKRMEWNLLMNGRHERRIGYTWIEFGRRDERGDTEFVTLGCGLRAIAGRPSVDSWFFMTAQRPGAELWLTTPERTALSRERLTEAIGQRGQVFETAQAYRRAVDERLFQLGAERYGALVDTLIQLRQPQLSKQPNEERLSAALTEALRPLDRGALEDVAQAMSQLEDMRRELQELDLMRKSVSGFGARYRRYAQIASRRRAKLLRQAQSEFDTASREVNAAQAELDAARSAVARHEHARGLLEEELAADGARLSVLQADPVMRDAQRLAAERDREIQARRELTAAESRVKQAEQVLAEESRAALRRRTEAQGTRASVVETQGAAAQLAAQVGVQPAHTQALADAPLPDGAAALEPDFLDSLTTAVREALRRRREQIALIRRRLREVQIAAEARTRAEDARALHADAFDAASVALGRSVDSLAERAAALLADWRRHLGALRVLELPDHDDWLGALESWTETLSGANPLRLALDRARQMHEEKAAAGLAELAALRQQELLAQSELGAERERLERGEDQMPPAPHARGDGVRAGRVGAPLWQLIDFHAGVPAETRAGLEAALEAAGVLDAWVLPDGAVLDPRTHDLLLSARPGPPLSEPAAGTLARWLTPTIPATGAGADIASPIVLGLLQAIAGGDVDPTEAELWISPHGEFRYGAVRGAWTKPAARYIGRTAREAARQARLGELATLLAAIEDSLATITLAASELERLRDRARSEVETAPVDEPLQLAHAARSVAEQQRREAQARLGEAETRLITTEHAHSRARDALELDAADLGLPHDSAALDGIDATLNDYRLSVNDLVNAIRRHQGALGEAALQTRRELRAREEHATSVGDRADRHVAWLDAAETVRALQSTVGKQVDELLREIEATKRTRLEHEEAQKRTLADLIASSARQGTALQKCDGAQARLEERVQARKQAIDGLRAFALGTELLSVALPDVELPAAETPWGIELALNLARRTEQSLSEVPSEDADWSRIQQDISREVTDLQSAMSAQGHTVIAEFSDYGMVVRIGYRQKPERPDALLAHLDEDLAARRLILSAQEREVLENHLEKEIAANLQYMIRDTEQRVAAINKELHARPTSTGVRYRLDWQVLPEDLPDGAPGLAEARKRLLRTSADAWSADDRRQVGEFLQSRIAGERARDEQTTLFESLARALDYRRWHRFRVQRLQDGAWKPLAGPASSGERALGLTVPLFAAASSHYESAGARAPRLVLLDEAFAGVDDEARANCMALIREFDLDFVMTSEREWGCYPDLPGLAICQLARREGMDAVHVSRWTWDGRVRRAAADRVQRFPDAHRPAVSAATIHAE